jgi:hypothetical protein
MDAALVTRTEATTPTPAAAAEAPAPARRPVPELDMDALVQELGQALLHIENLRRTEDYEASGYVGAPVFQPLPGTRRSPVPAPVLLHGK